MKMLCDERVRCPDISPLSNFSSEAPDRHIFLGSFYVQPDGPPFSPIHIEGHTIIVGGCSQFSSGMLHQEDADNCAARHSAMCANDYSVPDPCLICHPDNTDPTPIGFIQGNPAAGNACCNPAVPKECCCESDPADPDPPAPPGPPNPPPPPLYANAAQTCTIYCPNGKPFSFTVPRGTFVGQSQAQADSMAYSAACNGAQRNRICVDDLTVTVCQGEQVSFSMTGSVRNGDPHYSVAAGAPPAGVTLNADGTFSGAPSGFTGTNFVVKLCDSAGNCATANVRVNVLSIVTDSPLPNATNGTAYNAAVVGGGGTAPYSYGWNGGGTVPEGLTVNSNGTITGTPTGGGVYNFGIFIQDANGNKCSKSFQITVLSISSAPQNLDVVCPSNPAIHIQVSVAAGKYNTAPGAYNGQNLVDSRAYADAVNQASDYLNSHGCCAIQNLSIPGNLPTDPNIDSVTVPCDGGYVILGYDTVGQTGGPTHGRFPGSGNAFLGAGTYTIKNIWDACHGSTTVWPALVERAYRFDTPGGSFWVSAA